MHGVSVHSALAIKRQRNKKRAFSSSSSSGRRNRRPPPSSLSNPSLASYLARQDEGTTTANKVMGTITMLQIGGIFTLIGVLLILATLLTNQTAGEMAELIGTGIICLIIGIFLLFLNRLYGRREEEDLEHYVEARLGRTKDGERIIGASDFDSSIV